MAWSAVFSWIETLLPESMNPKLRGALEVGLSLPRVGLILAMLILLGVSYDLQRVSLLADAPYEGWDEVPAYQIAHVITDPVRWRVYAYGTLDTAKMVLSLWYYERTDPISKQIRDLKAYSNNVPDSWAQPGFDFHARNWADLSAIDFNYFRGIPDRRPFRIAREINLAFLYLLAAATVVLMTWLYGFRAIPVYVALAFLFTSSEFYYGSNFCLPNSVCALLAFITVCLCLSAIYAGRPQLAIVAAIVVAIGVNHKADFLVLALPVAIAVIAASFRSGDPVKGVAILGMKSVACFTATLLITDPYLIVSPVRELGKQASVIASLQGDVSIERNIEALWHFLGANFSLRPELDVIGAHGILAACVGMLLIFGLLPALIGMHLSRWRRLAAGILVIGTVAALFVLPIRNSTTLYERYFLNGWGAILAAAGCGLSAALMGASRSARVVGAIACVMMIPIVGVMGQRFGRIRELEVSVAEALDPRFHLDTHDARNLLTLEAIRDVTGGAFSNTILIDQHSYLDLRPFLVTHLRPVYVNAWNYQDVVKNLPPGRYLALFSKGTPQIEPRWAGAWPEEIQARYAAEIKFLSEKPILWERPGSIEHLLDWAPPKAGDNVSLAVVSTGQ
jgi:hypothetical protein